MAPAVIGTSPQGEFVFPHTAYDCKYDPPKQKSEERKRDSMEPVKDGYSAAHDHRKQQPPGLPHSAKERIPWSEKEERAVMEPYDYIAAMPGKGFRSQLILELDKLLKIPSRSLEVISNSVGLLHTASLLIDDIQDGSDLRRGLPAAHIVFGTPQTINTANYVYFAAVQELMSLGNPKLIAIFLEEVLNAHRGQGLDLLWRDSMVCPSEHEYFSMVQDKTGALFRLAFRLMEAESTCPPSQSTYDALIQLLDTSSVLFQVADDYKNLCNEDYEAKKGFAEDLTEGKLSLPAIHAIHADKHCHTIQNILKQRTTNLDVKRYAILYMKQKGSLKYTRQLLRQLAEDGGKQLDVVEKLSQSEGQWLGMRKLITSVMALTQ